jgi:chromosome segregation ATPase
MSRPRRFSRLDGDRAPPLARGLQSLPRRRTAARKHNRRPEERDMDEISFQDKMNQILDRIRELPTDRAAAATEGIDSATARRERVQASVNELQDALDYLRLSVKYLVFDLEATRRENAYLRRMIEQSNRERQQPPETREDERPDFDGNGWE